DQLAWYFRRKPLGQNRVVWPVAFKDPMGHQPIRCALRLHLLGRFAERKRLGLGENIGQQHVMMPANRIQSFDKGNEVTRDETGALMDQLIERVLTVGPRLTPIDGTGIM